MNLSKFTNGSKPFPFASLASNAACAVSLQGKASSPCQDQRRDHRLTFLQLFSFPCEHVFACAQVTNCVCVSACAHTPSAWHAAKGTEITSWRKHYSIAFSIQITQKFIATSATTGGEGWTLGRLAGLALHGAVLSDALWQQVKRKVRVTYKEVFVCSRERTRSRQNAWWHIGEAKKQPLEFDLLHALWIRTFMFKSTPFK